MNTNILSYIGNTPMVKLSNKTNKYSEWGIDIYVKLEYFNPTGSIKDRMVKYVIDDAFKTGKIQAGGTVVEASSGNTATSLSMICALFGLKTVLFTNTKCSNEKINNIKLHGSTLHVLPLVYSKSSPEHYENVAFNYAKENPDFFHFNQYNNPKNAQTYYDTLGPEIWDNMQGQLNYFVVGGGTYGTITGTGSFFKSKNKNIKVILVDIAEQSSLIEGLSISQDMNHDNHNHVVDDILKIEDKEAFNMCHILAKNEGIFSGGSGGCNVIASLKLAEMISKNNNVDQQVINIVTLIPDSGFKYMSKIYNPTWLQENNIILLEQY
jgi:cysteine synthase